MLGFCGEVLLSIVLVLMFEFKMSMGEEVGIYFKFRGGEIVYYELMLSWKGIEFVIENLFFNIFVCLKYMKMVNMEFGNVMDVVNCFVMFYFEVLIWLMY